MPEVHLPHLDDEDEHQPEASIAAPHQQPRGRGRHVMRLLLEVVLISAGVFLGLAGEQWRESREHRERAEASLRRFHTELGDNKKTVAAVRDYHVTLRAGLKKFLAATPKERKSISFAMRGIQPALFETTAWDLAIATQALTDIPQDLAYDISRLYRIQQEYAQLTQGMLNSMYINSPYASGDGFMMSVAVYLDDVVLLEPQLLKVYDEVLAKIEGAHE